MKDWFLNTTYFIRLRIANFISGGDLQIYSNLYEAHSTMRTITNSIAMQALNKATIEEAKEFYNTEFRSAEKQHFERVFNIIENRS